MQRFFIFIAGFLITLSSAGAETIGDSHNNLAAQPQEPLLQLAQSLPPPCSRNDACYEKVTPPFTQRWCPTGSGFQIFVLFGNTTVNVASKSCGNNLPGTCSQHCN